MLTYRKIAVKVIVEILVGFSSFSNVNNGLSVDGVFAGNVEGEDRTCKSLGITVVGGEESYINSKAVVLFASTYHVSSSCTGNARVVTYRVIEVRTARHVKQRQSSDTPLMTITRGSAEEAVKN